mgnify:CR=1 FL=1
MNSHAASSKKRTIVGLSLSLLIAGATLFAGSPVHAHGFPGGVGGPGGAKYFVIVGSFKSKAQARKRNAMFGDTFIAHTNNYPNLRNGYWVVMEGPYSKGYAKSIACQEAVPDCYVKAGW